MNPKIKLYIKYISKSIGSTLKPMIKYFSIWLAIGTWLPWLCWKYMFKLEFYKITPQGSDYAMFAMFLFISSFLSVMVSVGIYFAIRAIRDSIKEYFIHINDKIQADMYREEAEKKTSERNIALQIKITDIVRNNNNSVLEQLKIMDESRNFEPKTSNIKKVKRRKKVVKQKVKEEPTIVVKRIDSIN